MTAITNAGTSSSKKEEILTYYQSNKKKCGFNSAHTTIEKMQTCSGCHFTSYCNRDCQKLDWERHKKACKKLAPQHSSSTKNEMDEGKSISKALVFKTMEAIRDRLGSHVAKAMLNITAMGEHCEKNYVSNPKLVEEGYWYAEDLANALKKLNTKESLLQYEEMREQGLLDHGSLPPSLFDPVLRYKVRRDFEWTVKAGIKPSEIIKAAQVGFRGIKNGVAVIDCGATVTLARYIGLLTFLEEANGSEGVEKFDRLFSRPHGLPINIGYYDDAEQPLRYFIIFTEAAKKHLPGKIGKRPIKIGQALQLKGVPTYSNKHPNGQCSHYNVVCTKDEAGNQQFAGHGILQDKSSEMEIYRMMAEEYNAEPDHFSRAPSNREDEQKMMLSQRNVNQWEKHTVSLKNPEIAVEGYDRGSPQDFVPQLISTILDTPVAKITLQMIINHPYVSKDYTDNESENDIAAQKNMHMTDQLKLLMSQMLDKKMALGASK